DPDRDPMPGREPAGERGLIELGEAAELDLDLVGGEGRPDPLAGPDRAGFGDHHHHAVADLELGGRAILEPLASLGRERAGVAAVAVAGLEQVELSATGGPGRALDLEVDAGVDRGAELIEGVRAVAADQLEARELDELVGLPDRLAAELGRDGDDRPA